MSDKAKDIKLTIRMSTNTDIVLRVITHMDGYVEIRRTWSPPCFFTLMNVAQ